MKQKYQNLAVMIVDMQDNFLFDWEKVPLVKSHKKIFNFAKNKNLPLIFLEYHGRSSTIPELQKEVLKYANKNYLIKYKESGFKNLIHNPRSGEDIELTKFLKEKNISRIIISGVNKRDCVMETVEGAKRNGYEILASKDLMNDPLEENDFYQKNAKYFNKVSRLIKHLKK